MVKCQLHIYPLVEEVQMRQEEPVSLKENWVGFYWKLYYFILSVDDYDEPRYMAVNSYDNRKLHAYFILKKKGIKISCILSKKYYVSMTVVWILQNQSFDLSIHSKDLKTRIGLSNHHFIVEVAVGWDCPQKEISLIVFNR